MASAANFTVRSEIIKLVALLLCLTFALIYADLLWRWDRLIYDAQSRILERPVSEEIVIIAIDENSLQHIGRWPWSRRVHAQLIEQLTQYKVKTVVFDVIFAEANQNDPLGDQELANAIKTNGRVILPVLLEQTRLRGQLIETLPLPVLLESAATVGHVHVELDPDGIARSTFLYEGLGEPRWPHIGLAAVNLDSGQPVLFEAEPGSARNEDDVSPWMWKRAQPFLIPFAGPPGSFKTISYWNVLNGRLLPGALENKVVLIGVTATGLGDALPTPVSALAQPMPGVEINANIYQAINTNKTIRRIASFWHYALALVFVLVPMIFFRYFSPRASLLLVIGLACLLFVASFVILHTMAIWIPVAAVLVSVLSSYPLWTWRRLEFTIKSLNNALKRLSLETRDAQPDKAIQAEQAFVFLQSIMPLKGMSINDESGKKYLLMGVIDAHTAKLPNHPDWRQMSARLYGRQLVVGGKLYYSTVEWNDNIHSMHKLYLQLLDQYLLQQKLPTNVPTYSTSEIMESRVREVVNATDKLAYLRRFIADSLSQMADAVIVVNGYGRITLANQRAGEYLCGDPSARVLHEPVYSLLDSVSITSGENWPSLFKDTLLLGESKQCQVRNKDRDFMVYMSPLSLHEEIATSVIVNITDITPIKQAERRRNEVLGFLSHDLRAPLVSVLALVEQSRLEKHHVDKPAMEKIAKLANSAIELAENFVHLTRVESDPKIEFNDVNLVDIAANASDSVWDQAEGANITITQQYCDEAWVRGNGSILERVFVNLITNAIKYSPEYSEIHITIQQQDSRIQCCVEDNGVGIAEHEIARLFDRFERAEQAGLNKQKGIGLGLAFVRAAVERHDGTISVDSVINKGSRFCFYLPICRT